MVVDVKHKSLRSRKLQLFQPVQLFVSDIFGRVRIPRRRGGKRTADKNEQAVDNEQNLEPGASEGRKDSLLWDSKNSPQRGVDWREDITGWCSPSDSRLHTDSVLPPPILSLPDELLGDIFVSCVPQFATAQELQDGCPALWGPHPHVVRRYLTQVCHRWRTIAINTPMLWTNLVLGRNLKRDREDVKLWLSYSRGCPLSILVRARKWPGSKTLVSSLIRLLKDDIGRIRCFVAQHLHWEELLELFPVQSGVVLQLPLMEVFYIREYIPRFLDGDPGNVLPEPDMGQVYTPKLLYLELAEAHLLTCFMTTSFLPVRFLILAAAKFPVPSSTYLQFLSCCPELYSLGFFNEVPILNMITMLPQNRLTLPGLRDLRFYADHTPDTMLFLHSIHMPSLSRLRFGQYDSTQHPAGYVLQVYWHFLTETAPTIEMITLNNESLPIGDITAGPLLKNLKNLRTIVFHDVQLKSDVLEALIPQWNRPPEQWPCPRLAFLTLENVDIEGDSLPRLISARALSDRERREHRAFRRQQKQRSEGKDAEDLGEDAENKKDENGDIARSLGSGWRNSSMSSLLDVDPLSEGRLVWVHIRHCNILSEDALTALLELERTHSHAILFG